MVEEIKKAGAKVLRNNEWQIEDKLVLKKRKVYVPKDASLRLEIIQLHHDMPIAEQQRTVEDSECHGILELLYFCWTRCNITEQTFYFYS